MLPAEPANLLRGKKKTAGVPEGLQETTGESTAQRASGARRRRAGDERLEKLPTNFHFRNQL